MYEYLVNTSLHVTDRKIIPKLRMMDLISRSNVLCSRQRVVLKD